MVVSVLSIYGLKELCSNDTFVDKDYPFFFWVNFKSNLSLGLRNSALLMVVFLDYLILFLNFVVFLKTSTCVFV